MCGVTNSGSEATDTISRCCRGAAGSGAPIEVEVWSLAPAAWALSALMAKEHVPRWMRAMSAGPLKSRPAKSAASQPLVDALRELDDSEVMAKYIDPKYIDIFVACKESELEEFEHSISDLEYNWYLHTV